jgi:peptide/nickel transport system ATP-binding protein
MISGTVLAFDPVYTVGQQIIEGLRRHEGLSRVMLKHVRWTPCGCAFPVLSGGWAYPHEMSGGAPARDDARWRSPAIRSCCWPTSPPQHDATVQIQILILLREQQKLRDLSIIFVTHDIGAAVEIADRVAVMYAGRIVEKPIAEILPRHPYTRVLLGSRPKRG